MSLHKDTFQYLKPTPEQMSQMQEMRDAFDDIADAVGKLLPEGPDKTHVQRVLRTAAMWANIAITRQPDGTPRD